MASDYQLDENPRDRAEILRRDRVLRDVVSRMSRNEKRTFIEFLIETTGNSKAHIYKCLKADADPSSKAFRTLLSYGKSKVPEGMEIPKSANPQDVMFNLKLRIGESIARGVESGGARPRVNEGTRNGESTRGFGNTVSGIDTERMGRYLLNDKLMNCGLQTRLYFQAGGGVYLQYWHDSPSSSGEAEAIEDWDEGIDFAAGWY